MVYVILIAGTIGFSALLAPDLCCLTRRRRLAALSSFFGYSAVLIALVLQVTSFRPAAPLALRVAAAVASGVFAVLLVYSVLLEIPLRGRSPAGSTPALYTAGTYRLSRHPGLLWFLLMQLSLNAIYLDGSFVAVSLVLALGDLGLVAVQDLYVFPLTFPGYAAYKLRVPFLFPRFRTG
jgi:protein-S-isoprenylcysteine O-methyltransferase Ste14